MDKLLVDTNLIVEYLKNGGGLLPQIWDHYKLALSVVSFTELLASKRAAHPSANRQLRDFVAEKFELVPVDAELAAAAATIMRDQACTLAASIVAATAIQLGVPLITYDLKTFDQIPNLKLVDI